MNRGEKNHMCCELLGGGQLQRMRTSVVCAVLKKCSTDDAMYNSDRGSVHNHCTKCVQWEPLR